MKEDNKLAPNLPGFYIPDHYKKEDFKKSHKLTYLNGFKVYPDIRTPSLSGHKLNHEDVAEILKKTELALQYGERPLHLDIKSNIGTEKAPRSHGKVEFSRFTKFDGIVLTFDGYIRDDIPDGVRGPALGVHDPRAKEYTIRNVVIRYFMEDGTLSIVEVPTYDSGLIAAPIIKRQMVKKAYGSNADGLQNSEVITIQDIVLGQDLKVCGKKYHIVSCDPFTEKFARDYLDMSFAQTSETIPVDPYVHARMMVKKASADGKSKESPDAWLKERYRKFLANYGKVLRFYCLWDVTDSLNGDVKTFELHYYLVDDTIEVRCTDKTKTRDVQSLLVRRQMLPKEIKGINDLAGTTPLGTDIDVNPPKPVNFYKWNDLKIGAQINVLGRQFKIIDIDGFTRQFFKANGFRDNQLQAIESYIERKSQEHVRTQENANDEAKKHASLLAKHQPEKRVNIFKILQNEGKSLSFKADLVTDNVFDSDRHFIVQFKLAEELICVSEPSAKMSNEVGGGKMAERALVVNETTGDYYKAPDFYVGAVIKVYGRRYQLTEADEFSYNWMTSHPSEFAHSNLKIIKTKLAVFKSVIGAFIEDTNLIPLKDLVNTIVEVSENVISEHEAIIYGRTFCDKQNKRQVNVAGFLDSL